MTREELRDEMGYNFAEKCVNAPSADNPMTFEDAYIQGWKDADEHPKNLWISVKERLPEELQIVFVHTQGGSYDCMIYINGSFERDLQLNFGMKDSGYTIISWHQKFKSNITHWMPMPELNEGGKNEKG